MVITVGRQYGSGGREIGTALANKLGIVYYDDLLLKMRRRKAAFVRSCSTASTSAPRAFFIPLRWTRIPSPCTM